MNAGKLYLLGVAFVTGLGALMVALAPAAVRWPAGWGAAMGLALQAPLGWWVVASIGTGRFVLVWALGMGARLLVLALAGFVVIPRLGWAPEPALGALVSVLLALLFVEGITVWQQHSEEGEQR